MSKIYLKQKALLLRKKGYSYNRIKKSIPISKSTLSNWLSNFPLTKSQIDNLRGKNPRRIERFRETMKKKRVDKENMMFEKVKSMYSKVTKRELIIAGMYLYWGEGTKSAPATIAMTNTDPDLLKFFLKWLKQFGIKSSEVSVVLHIYSDMNYIKERQFWSSYLRVPLNCFKKPQIKNSRLKDVTYKNGFGHGTCSVKYFDQDMHLFIMAGLRMIRIMHT